MIKKKRKKKVCPFRNQNISQTASWLIATLLKTSTERRWEEANAGGGASSQCWASGLGCDQGARTSPEPGGGVDDSHLQQPRGPVAVAAAAAAAAAATPAVPAVSRLLSVSVRVGSVDMEETLLEEEDMEVWCWWCCWGLLLTVAPVL